MKILVACGHFFVCFIVVAFFLSILLPFAFVPMFLYGHFIDDLPDWFSIAIIPLQAAWFFAVGFTVDKFWLTDKGEEEANP